MATLWTTHWDVLQEVIETINSIGYSWLNLDTPVHRSKDHGLPQSRSRLILFAVRMDVMACEYDPPPLLAEHLSIDLCVPGQPPKRPRNAWEQDILTEQKKKWKEAGYSPSRHNIIVDVVASKEFAYGLLEMCPCITATRGTAAGLAFTNMRTGNFIGIKDMVRLQGYALGLWKWKGAGVSLPRFGHMIGNAVPANVLHRLLPAAMKCAGLVKPTASCCDAWGNLVNEAHKHGQTVCV